MHGDHSFGLPARPPRASSAENRDSNAPGKEIKPVEIYGPAGLRLFIRAALQMTHSRVAAPYRVHELHGACPRSCSRAAHLTVSSYSQFVQVRRC